MFVRTSNEKGAIAEAEIAAAAVRLGIPVLRPITEHARYDLAFEIGDKLHRVQCKWGSLRGDSDVVSVHTGTCRHTPNGGYVRTTYDVGEIDQLAVYCGDLDRCYLLPVQLVAGKQYVYLRLRPARNGQRACITLAQEYEFAGAVAQLARALPWHGRGRGFESLQLHLVPPAPETVENDVGANEFRNRLGWYMERAAAGETFLVRRRGRPRVRLMPAS